VPDETRRDQMAYAAGYDKIKTVELQQVREDVFLRGDPNVIGLEAYEVLYLPDQIVDEFIWIETESGDVYLRTLLKGETGEVVCASYRKRGWTDNKCTLFA
jgi:hypothetical protein